MNLSLARQHYSMAKENQVDTASQNAFAIKLAMEQLIEAMECLTSAKSVESKELHFETALTRIYLLQKCLDFEKGGELARNLFRIYEHARQSTIKITHKKMSDTEFQKTIEFIKIIHEGWDEMLRKE